MSSYGLWLAAAGMKVNDHRQSILANNLANANTTGFKHDLAVVMQRRVESQANSARPGAVHPVLDGMSGGVNVRPTFYNFSAGNIENTGKPLDAAIRGDGFFVVSDGESTRYTRDGEFTRNRDGELALAAGNGRWKVLSGDGATIVLSETGGKLSIGANGSVREGQTLVAELAVVNGDRESLRKVGENLFEGESAQMEPIDPRLIPEAREESNFDVMQGLASMIESSRAYELNAQMIRLHDQMTGLAVSRVGRVA